MAITDDSSLANLHFLPPGDDLPDILCLDRIHIDGCSSSWSLALCELCELAICSKRMDAAPSAAVGYEKRRRK